MRKRWKILATLKNLKAINPSKKNRGSMVKRSTIPSKEKRNLTTDLHPFSPYRYSAVHIRAIYSIQNIMVVTHSIPRNMGKAGDRDLNVRSIRDVILRIMVLTIKRSKNLLGKSPVCPICIMSNNLFLSIPFMIPFCNSVN